MFELQDNVALVTGGSRGIGRALCIALGKQGAYVAVNYATSETGAVQTLDAIRAAGGNGETLRFDVTDAAATDGAILDLAKRKGRLDILVNNAAIALDQLLVRLDAESVEKTFATNVAGALWCSKAAIRPMMRARRGRIINVSSLVAESGNPGQSVYSASKAALIGLTKSMAREYASRSITVNAVAPGFIDIGMTAGMTADAKQSIIARTPLGRHGTPEEVAAAVVFLASDEASFITGQVIRVNGGMYV